MAIQAPCTKCMTPFPREELEKGRCLTCKPRRRTQAQRAEIQDQLGTKVRSKAEWFKVRAMVLERDGHTCQWCYGPGSVVDHVVPIVDLESHEWYDADNLQTLCVSCHGKKTAWEVGQRKRKESSTPTKLDLRR